MSQDFRKVLVLDDRLRVKSDVDFAVFKGASSKVESTFTAISASQNQITFNIQVPSELTIMDREFILDADLSFNVSGVVPIGQRVLDYGNGHAFAPFPLQSLFSTSTATINNNSVSQNTSDVLAAINRFHDRRYLARYNGATPTAYDTYQNYSDAVNSNNNPNGSYSNTSDNDLMPRGAFALTYYDNPVSVSDTVPTVAGIGIKVREPLLLSPFLYCDPEKENQGFYGIQNLNFLFNIGQQNVQRVIRGINPYTGTNASSFTITPVDFTQNRFRMLINMLTAPNSVLLPPRNVVPYYELPRYVSAISASGVQPDAQATISSPSIQLNQIPDKLIIFVRKLDNNRGVGDSDCFLPINNISINFNNVSGLLSSSDAHDLWKMSVKSGSNLSWLEFSGQANKYNPAALSVSNKINTSGSMLILDFAREIALSEEYYAPSSLGQFLLQFNLGITNNTLTPIGGNTHELVIITMNSGVFVCERGTSSTFTALLTKQDVLDASQDESSRMSYSDARRLVGGKFDAMQLVKANLPKAAGVAKVLLEQSNNPKAKTAAKVLGALGYGYEGDGRGFGVGLGSKMASHLM